MNTVEGIVFLKKVIKDKDLKIRVRGSGVVYFSAHLGELPSAVEIGFSKDAKTVVVKAGKEFAVKSRTIQSNAIGEIVRSARIQTPATYTITRAKDGSMVGKLEETA